jgi:hypothetical protein
MQLAISPTLPFISTPIDTTRKYLATGWVQESAHKYLVYYHNGSNSLWSSMATFIPGKNTYWLMVANGILPGTMSALEHAKQMILHTDHKTPLNFSPQAKTLFPIRLSEVLSKPLCPPLIHSDKY